MSFKDDLKEHAKEEAIGLAVGAGGALALKGFRGWMTKFALKRPDGLVARFRRTFGLESEEEIRAAHEKMLQSVGGYLEELDKKKKKP